MLSANLVDLCLDLFSKIDRVRLFSLDHDVTPVHVRILSLKSVGSIDVTFSW